MFDHGNARRLVMELRASGKTLEQVWASAWRTLAGS